MYLASAILHLSANWPGRRMNNLCALNAAVSPIPTAPTNISFISNDLWLFKGPQGAINARQPALEALDEQLYCSLLEAPWELLACRCSSLFEYLHAARVPVAL